MYYVISDLHMCDKGPRDTFCLDGRLNRFRNFLDWVSTKENFELIVVGDLLDFWRVNIGSSVDAYKDILDRLYQMNTIYVLGNHDDAFINFLNTNVGLPHELIEHSSPPFNKKIGDREFTFLHGHEIDKFCKNIN